MMWAMWSMEERKKGYGNGRGTGKDGIKEEGKKLKLVKKSEIDSNQQCLQHIHAEASGAGRPQAPSGALTVTVPAHPRPPQHCKQISMEMVRFTDGIQARIPRFSTQLPNRTEKWAVDQWTKGPQKGFAIPTACRLLAAGRQARASSGQGLSTKLPIYQA